MNELVIKNYNLEATLLGGQAFNWDFIGGSYYGFMQDKVVKITPARLEDSNSQKLYWKSFPQTPENNNLNLLADYLNINLDFDKVILNIQKDEHITKAINKVQSVRILNQDFEQTLLSFILTSNKNIKSVRKIVRDLSKMYGEKIIVDGIEFYLFPKTEIIANLSELELRKIGAGFRAKYLKNAAERLLELRKDESIGASRRLAPSKTFPNTKALSEVQIRELLLQFNGIGEKIADCIMVFSLGFTTITPLDIWGKRVLIDLYKLDPKMKYSEMREWYREYFGEYTVYAGQFLFEWYRKIFLK